MKVKNNTSEKLIAFCYHIDHGYGKDTVINPGEEIQVPGPFVGKMENMTGQPNSGNCYLIVQGETTVTCHEGPDNEEGYHIAIGEPIFLFNEQSGITIRHHSDKRDTPHPPDYGD